PAMTERERAGEPTPTERHERAHNQTQAEQVENDLADEVECALIEPVVTEHECAVVLDRDDVGADEEDEEAEENENVHLPGIVAAARALLEESLDGERFQPPGPVGEQRQRTALPPEA